MKALDERFAFATLADEALNASSKFEKLLA